MTEEETKGAGATTGGTGSNISDEVGLVRPTVAPAQAAGATVPILSDLTGPSAEPVDLPPSGPDIHADIEKILKEVKLPERRDSKGIADQKRQPMSPITQQSSPSAPAEPTLADALSGVVSGMPKTTSMPTAGDTSSIVRVHTLKDDLQHVVKEKKMSLVRAVSLEQDKKLLGGESDEDFGRAERRKRVSAIIFSSLILLGLGAAALFGVYIVMQSHAATSTVQLNSLIFAEQSVSLPLEAAPSTLKEQIASFRSSPGGSLGSITRIVPTMATTDSTGKASARPSTLKEFLSALGTNPPDELVRALGDEFFFGVHVVDKNAPVLVATVTSYDHAFAGMLAWETTMNQDLAPAYTAVPVTQVDHNGIPSQRLFKDDVMRNYDVRELKDDAGQVQLFYSFPNPHLLIIAESPYTFPEILSRLQSENKL